MYLVDNILDYIKNEYDVEPNRPWQKSPLNMTFKIPNDNKWFALIMPVNRKSLNLDGSGTIWVINLKVREDFGLFSGNVNGVMPAYHMNKKHWITILLDGSVDENIIYQYIDTSYKLVSDSPTKRIYEAVKLIPKGKVATYGMVAQLAGNPKMSRAVGNALHKNPSPDTIPCYRVVNSKGELSGEFAFGGINSQASLLMKDEIDVVDGKVDLSKYLMKL